MKYRSISSWLKQVTPLITVLNDYKIKMSTQNKTKRTNIVHKHYLFKTLKNANSESLNAIRSRSECHKIKKTKRTRMRLFEKKIA